jgi:hypothetical protein
MAEIRSFRDLNVYQKAREAARAIFELTKSFPKGRAIRPYRSDSTLVESGERNGRRSVGKAPI